MPKAQRTLSTLLANYPTVCSCVRIPSRTGNRDANVEQWDRSATHWHITLTSHDSTPDGCRMMPPRAFVSLEFSQGSAHEGVPDLRTVLGCMISDALCARIYQDVDEFAVEMGYTTPSRAFAAWQGCRDADAKLKSLYGVRFDPADVDTEGY